jgi:hypothetical protein
MKPTASPRVTQITHQSRLNFWGARSVLAFCFETDAASAFLARNAVLLDIAAD